MPNIFHKVIVMPIKRKSNKPKSNKFSKKTNYDRSFGKKTKSYKDDRESFKKEEPKKTTSPKPKLLNDGPIRLNKFIASAGVCSRREADEFIKAGVVSINGKIVTEMGTKVSRTDKVQFNNDTLSQEKLVYVLLNKPKDHVTTLDDPHAKKTIMNIVGKCCEERIYPVGRLDKNTTGVLLLTNDGDLTTKLTHPKYNKKKIYEATLDKNFTKNDMLKIVEGFDLEDGFIKSDEISYVDNNDKKVIGIEIHSGKNRIVRRIFEHLGYNVVKLDRVYFGGLTKKGLNRGKWRFLTDKEVSILKKGGYQ